MRTTSKPRNITFESDVPMPVRSKLPELPLGELTVGGKKGSFVITLNHPKERDAVRQRYYRYAAENPPKRFTARTVKQGDEAYVEGELRFRVHRLEDA
jgi:hypothetical protein